MEKDKKISTIRYIYLYLVTAITIVLLIISLSGLIRILMNEYVFGVKGYEEIDKNYWECSDDALFYMNDVKGVRVLKQTNLKPEEMEAKKQDCIVKTEERRKLQHINDVKRDIVWSLSMLIVALPLYLIHWGIIRRDNKKK